MVDEVSTKCHASVLYWNDFHLIHVELVEDLKECIDDSFSFLASVSNLYTQILAKSQ